MSAFHERMKKLAEALSPAAKEIVKQVLSAEHRRRFADRKDLPEMFASAALKCARAKDGHK